jgi:pimeloyl-ACP methyl ester carboxylesterase
MGPENVAEFGAALGGEAALTAFLDQAAAGMASVTGADVAAALGGLVKEADKAVLTGGYAEHIAAALRGGVRAGIAGWRDDDLAFAKDWGLSRAWPDQSPVAIWQGDQDLMVPYAHGRWLAAAIPGARDHLLPGEGHLSLTVSRFGDILDDLLELAKD